MCACLGFLTIHDWCIRGCDSVIFPSPPPSCSQTVQAHVVHYGARCLKSLVSAIHPGMGVLPADVASGEAVLGYQPRKTDVSK